MYPSVVGFVILCAGIGDVALISVQPSMNASAELLWRLSQLAVAEGRRSRPQHYSHQYQQHLAQQAQYMNYYSTRYPDTHQQTAYPFATGLGAGYPGTHAQTGPPGSLAPQQTIMEALDSIAQNDQLHCVPRLLCEMLSGDSRQTSSSLPTFINLSSLLTLLRSLDVSNSSPLLKFGRAALLGYTSRGNVASCRYSYPQCPGDPDKLVDYLNNYNGGFFRFFGGVQQSTQQRPQFFPHTYQAQKRIQTKPNANNERDVVFNGYDHYRDKTRYGWKFPVYDLKVNNYANGGYASFNRQPHGREQKSLIFPSKQGNTVRAVHNEVPQPVYYSDRTGTGDLRLDLDPLRQPDNYFVFH